MITFSKKSWHYKLNDRVSNSGLPFISDVIYKKNLCGYFWCTMYNTILSIFLIGVVCWCLTVLGTWVYLSPKLMIYMPTNHILTLMITFISGIITLAAIAICFIVIIGGIYAVGYFVIKFIKFLFYKKVCDEEVPTKAGLLLEHLKAVKSKYCPLIEFKDE